MAGFIGLGQSVAFGATTLCVTQCTLNFPTVEMVDGSCSSQGTPMRAMFPGMTNPESSNCDAIFESGAAGEILTMKAARVPVAFETSLSDGSNIIANVYITAVSLPVATADLVTFNITFQPTTEFDFEEAS